LLGLKYGMRFGWHLHARLRLRIAAHARLPLARAEASETRESRSCLRPAASFHNAVKNRLDDHFGILASHLDYARDFFDQFRLGHLSPFVPRKLMASSMVMVAAAACRR
jgi:hypothetical protein